MRSLSTQKHAQRTAILIESIDSTISIDDGCHEMTQLNVKSRSSLSEFRQ